MVDFIFRAQLLLTGLKRRKERKKEREILVQIKRTEGAPFPEGEGILFIPGNIYGACYLA